MITYVSARWPRLTPLAIAAAVILVVFETGWGDGCDALG